MTLDALAKPAAETISGRFFIVSYLPVYTAALFLLSLVWAGAPGERIRFDRAWSTAASLGLAETLLITVVVALIALVTHPLQLSLVRLLEGDWPRWLVPLGRVMRRVQVWRRRRLAARAELPSTDTAPRQPAIDQAGSAGRRLRKLFPPEEHLRPTTLGNILAAAEDTAGRAYGWDATVAWPRLYPVLSGPVRAIVDDRRNFLDATTRLAITALPTTIAAAALLARSGWWVLLALAPLAVGWTAYASAQQAAVAYGEILQTAFDLYRFDLLRALRLSMPDNRETEIAANQELCTFWRQGKPISLTYLHPEPESTDPTSRCST